MNCVLFLEHDVTLCGDYASYRTVYTATSTSVTDRVRLVSDPYVLCDHLSRSQRVECFNISYTYLVYASRDIT